MVLVVLVQLVAKPMVLMCGERIQPLVFAVLAVLGLFAGCSARGTVSLVDAQTAVQVKTALVNDDTLGTLPIDVWVHGGMVTLQGTVRSMGEVDRALALARVVPGVVGARSELEIRASPAARVLPSATLPALAPEPESPSRFVAVGASWSRMQPGGQMLASASSLGPILRLRPGSGFGPSFGFSWIKDELQAGAGTSPLAVLRVRPVMAGGQYQVVQGRLAAGASLVAGYAFNRLVVDTTQAGPGRAIAVTNSFAWRPGAWVWYDIFPRVGLNVFGGYLFTRPELTFADDESISSRRVNAGTAILSVGVAYWVF